MKYVLLFIALFGALAYAQQQYVRCVTDLDCFKLGNKGGSFCNFLSGCRHPGICINIPKVCPKSYNPVCGCDGITHPNLCIAHSKNVSVLHEGPCKLRKQVGICSTQDHCAEGTFCSFPAGQCTGRGRCVAIPEICTQEWAPVCGCNGITYGNRCMAAAEGINVAYNGPCEMIEEALKEQIQF